MDDRGLNAYRAPIQGGRLTKFKGTVASIAPGLYVAATSALLFAGGAAQAANECGTATSEEIICDDGGSYSSGITYVVANDFTLILDDAGITVGNPGVKVTGGRPTPCRRPVANLSAKGTFGRHFLHLECEVNEVVFANDKTLSIGDDDMTQIENFY